MIPLRLHKHETLNIYSACKYFSCVIKITIVFVFRAAETHWCTLQFIPAKIHRCVEPVCHLWVHVSRYAPGLDERYTTARKVKKPHSWWPSISPSRTSKSRLETNPFSHSFIHAFIPSFIQQTFNEHLQNASPCWHCTDISQEPAVAGRGRRQGTWSRVGKQCGFQRRPEGHS